MVYVQFQPAYQNLRTRVEGSVNSFLSKQTWKPDLNKNQLRETLRKHIHDAPYLDAGVERIVDQVVNPKVYSVFMSQIEDVVYKFLGIERPKTKEKNGACGLKDLLPKDLDPVSPESDKNSLKDESLESLDINDINDFDRKQDEKVDEQRPQDEEMYKDKNRASSENGHFSLEEKTSDEAYKILSKNESNSNLNTSAKSDDKMDEEEEEVSPTFEPIDIMNLNESNISNDSHLSGISELTSHRSRSPDFSNELSRDNFEYSNQDSQLSKVSSDSRLSIVTDFGSSNHALTPIHDSSRDETTKDKYETKSSKDNFKAIRDLDLSKNKSTKSSFDFVKGKDVQDHKDTKDFKGTKSVSSKENSRDATDSSIKDKYDHKNKEKSKDSDSTKLSKSTKEKSASKDAKYYKDKNNERKRPSNEKYDKHSSEKYDKHSKSKPKDKIEAKESSDKIKDISENLKDNASKLKDEKLKEIDRKDNVNKEVKDLKDIYKEKIRELREKKELTEKEKLNKDKDVKLIKETKDKKDSLKDKKSYKKEHKSSSSSKNPINYHESKSSKTSEKNGDGKNKRSDSKDKAKRDEKRLLKDSKGKSHYNSKSDLSDKSDKSDSKKVSKSEKEDKGGKLDAKKDVKSGEKTTNGKKDAKSHLQQGKDRVEKSDGRKESKSDSPSKDKKRREDKKSKTKDDHSSLRKNSNDRRSTDRDGSNGSNNKTLPPSNSNSNVTSTKSSTSKDNHVGNSGSETSDSIEETQVSDLKTSQSSCKLSHKISSQLPPNEKSHMKMEIDNETYDRQEEEENADPRDMNLPLKKRLLPDKDESIPDVKLKKPKFAKNIHEAKKLMKIRKQMEKQKFKEDKKTEKKVAQETDQTNQSNTKNNLDNLEGMPDDERVQIIEIPDEEYEEPYPEKYEPRLMLDERSIIMPGTESCTNDFLKELCTRHSSSEMSNVPSEEAQATQDFKTDAQSNASHVEVIQDSQVSKGRHKDDSEEDLENKIKRTIVDEEKYRLQKEETSVSQKLEETAASEKSESLGQNGKNVKQSTEESTAIRDCNQEETRDDNEEMKNNNALEIRDDNKESSDEIEMHMSNKTDTIESYTDCMGNKSSSSAISDDNEDCRYFKTDNEKSERFSNFLESLELVENSSLEDIIESLGGKVVSSIPKSMAPPLPKLRKRSSSPLSDILVNNSDNNNDGHKETLSSSPNEDTVHNVKKRKFTKKPRFSNLCNPQGISNGENFVMPLSPDSDVSATSDKTALPNVIKEEKRYVTCFRDFYIAQSYTYILYLLYYYCCCTCFVPIL